jgi:glutaredoxin-like YruB-family protein
MEIREVRSFADLQEKLKEAKKSYVLIYKSGSQQSDCAYKNISSTPQVDGVSVLGVDVAAVRDVHKNYNVTTAPTLLEFEGTKVIKALKGCHDTSYYKGLFENALFVSQEKENGKQQKNVVIYTTPSCPWCNRLKQYLRMNKVRFRDVDVSKDPRLAQELVKKSGHQGVPQTEIDGKIIVGFDKKKIDQMLGLKA